MGNCKNCFKKKIDAATSPLKNSGATVRNHMSTEAFQTESNEILIKDKKPLLSKSHDLEPQQNFDAPSAKIFDKKKTIDDIKLIKKEFSEHFLFSYVPEENLDKIVKTMKFYTMDMQQTIFQQGNPGHTFFVLAKGIVEIIVNGEKKGFITEGNSFGELALINNTERTATIRTLDRVELWGLDRRVFRKALLKISTLNMDENKIFLQSLPFLKSLTDLQIEELLIKVVIQNFTKHQKILIEGDPGNLFYIIQEGQVQCSIKGKPIRSLNKGEYFGELALIYKTSRSATVIAISKTKVLSFGFKTLNGVLGENYQLMLYRNCIRIAFEGNKYLKQLTSMQIEKILDIVEVFSYEQEQVAIPQGAVKGNYLWIVVKGVLGGSKGTVKVFETLGAKWIYTQKFSVYKENFLANEEVDLAVIKTEKLKESLGCGLAERIQMNEIILLLEDVPLFKMLNEEKLVLLAKRVKIVEFEAGAVIFTYGDEGDCLYIIKEGQVEIHKDNIFIRRICKNNYFGERSILLNEKHTASVICKQKSILLKLNKEDFLAAIDSNFLSLLINRMNLQDDSVELNSLIIADLIGKGAFAKVYLSYNPKNKALYALKAISKKKIQFHSLQKSLKQEKNILQQVDHQFIVKLVKTFKDTKNIYFLLEFIQGLTLHEVLRILNLLKSEDCKFYFACLLETFEYLHKNSIIYRDLKPENVIVDQDGYLKLLDFGTAKVIQDRTFSVVGTPHYMAPEVILGKGYSFSADLWSLGVVLYEFICGAVPFGADEEDDPFTIYRSIFSGTIVYPSFVKINLREKQIIEILLNKHPPARSSATALKSHKWFSPTYWSTLQSRSLKPPYKPSIEIDQRNLQICIEQNRTINFIINKQETDPQLPKAKSILQDWDKDF